MECVWKRSRSTTCLLQLAGICVFLRSLLIFPRISCISKLLVSSGGVQICWLRFPVRPINSRLKYYLLLIRSFSTVSKLFLALKFGLSYLPKYYICKFMCTKPKLIFCTQQSRKIVCSVSRFFCSVVKCWCFHDSWWTVILWEKCDQTINRTRSW